MSQKFFFITEQNNNFDFKQINKRIKMSISYVTKI